MVGIVAVLRNFKSSGLEVEDRTYICQRHESESVFHYNLAEAQNTHSAAYVHPHDVGDDLVAEASGESYYTSDTRMDIGHDTYFLVWKHIGRKQSPDLFDGGLLNVVREDFDIVSLYCLHNYVSKFGTKLGWTCLI